MVSRHRKHTRKLKHSRKHSRRCIFRYKHTRKQHRKYQNKQQRRQKGGVSEDMPTIATVSGFPVLSEDDIGKTSVSVQGFGQMPPSLYMKMARGGELEVDN
jgi:hypothetical protein